MILQHFEEAPFAKKGFLDRKAIREHATALMEKFDVRPRGTEGQASGTLSGGNQQKVVFAKLLNRDLKLLILDEPTKGIDVGAKYEIYQLIQNLAHDGKTVLQIPKEEIDLANGKLKQNPL